MTDSQQNATPVPGSLSRALKHLRRQERALAILERQRHSGPRDGTLCTPDLWRVDAAAKRGQRQLAAAEAVYRDTLTTAVAVILETEQLATAEAHERRYQELLSLDESEIDQLWVTCDLVAGFAALGYPREVAEDRPEDLHPEGDRSATDATPEVAWPGLRPGIKAGKGDDAVRRNEISAIVKAYRLDHDGDEPTIAYVGTRLQYRSPKTFGRALRKKWQAWLDPELNWPPGAWFKRRSAGVPTRAHVPLDAVSN